MACAVVAGFLLIACMTCRTLVMFHAGAVIGCIIVYDHLSVVWIALCVWRGKFGTAVYVCMAVGYCRAVNRDAYML